MSEGLMMTIVLSFFSVSNKTKGSVWSISPRKLGELVVMSAVRVEKYEFKALAFFFRSSSFWLL